MQKWLTGSRIAFLISIGIHLIALITLKGVAIYSRSFKLFDAINISLVDSSDQPEITPPKTDNTQVKIEERVWVPVKRNIRILTKSSPEQIISKPLPARQFIGEIDLKKLPPKEHFVINTDVQTKPSLINLTPSASLSNESADGQASGSGRGRFPGQGDKESASGRIDSERLLPLTRKVPAKEPAPVDKLQIYKEADVPFIRAMQEIAKNIADNKSSNKVDITFLIDISESMEDDIDAIRRHINRMVDKLNETKIDFTIGVLTFHHNLLYEWLGSDIQIYPQTTDINEIKKILKNIKVSGGERPLDAIMKAVTGIKTRQGASRFFIFITDEYVKGTYTVSEVLQAVKRANITVNVLGRDEPFQRALAEQTGGIWMPIEKAEEQ